METAVVRCVACSTSFVPRLKIQVELRGSETVYYCSQRCRMRGLAAEHACSQCGTRFTPSLASQVADGPDGAKYYCSDGCRDAAQPKVEAAPAEPPPRVIAVLNQKGGTGKTTTAVSLAAGFAQVGGRTLLVDLDPQGNVGASLGVVSPRSMYHVMLEGLAPDTCAVPVRENLDVITSDQGLAAAEISLARSDESERMYALERAMSSLRGYDYVVLDCAPSLSVLNHNALYFAGEVLIPVSCDYLALVGVKQLLQTLRRVSEHSGRVVQIAGVLPTFYDVRNKGCVDALGYLRKTFGAKTLPPVRVNTKLAEAPSVRKTIFELAPESNGARDYVRVVEWLRTAEGAATWAA